MTYSFPILTAATLFLAGVFSAVEVFAGDQVAEAGAGPISGDGPALMAAATRQLLSLDAVEARIRQRVWLFGTEVTGLGLYQQFGRDDERLLRLELKLQAAGKFTSLQQVYDGRYFWSRLELPDKRQLTVVDLRRVRDVLRETGQQAEISLDDQWMALGGLPRLLHALDSQFDFSAPRAEQIGEVPVWALDGTWKPSARKQFLTSSGGEPRALPARLPPQLPEQVAVVLSRDPALPLFPFRIEYRRFVTDAEGQQSAETELLATLEFFEVRRRPLDRQLFVYQPGDQEVVDRTEAFLDRLTPAAQPRSKAAQGSK